MRSLGFSHSIVSTSLWPPWTAARQASLSFTISRSCSNSCPLSWWCHPTISSSVVPFSSCLQSFPASGSLQWVSSLPQVAKVLELQLWHQSFQNIQDWFPLGLTDLISLLSNGLSRVFFNTTIWRHRFFCSQPSPRVCPSPKRLVLVEEDRLLSTDTQRGDRVWRHRHSRLQQDRRGHGKLAATSQRMVRASRNWRRQIKILPRMLQREQGPAETSLSDF